MQIQSLYQNTANADQTIVMFSKSLQSLSTITGLYDVLVKSYGHADIGLKGFHGFMDYLEGILKRPNISFYFTSNKC